MLAHQRVTHIIWIINRPKTLPRSNCGSSPVYHRRIQGVPPRGQACRCGWRMQHAQFSALVRVFYGVDFMKSWVMILNLKWFNNAHPRETNMCISWWFGVKKKQYSWEIKKWMMTQNPHEIAETWTISLCVGTRGKHSAEWWNDEFEALNSHVKASSPRQWQVWKRLHGGGCSKCLARIHSGIQES